jgi:circadian clock protein KaiB
MRKASPKVGTSTTRKFEELLEKRDDTRYTLRLYVTGMTPRSRRAIESIKEICEEHLQGHYDLEIIDIYQRPTLAEGEQIIAAPTLIKVLPVPLRRLVGDLSDSERILLGLDLRPKREAPRREKADDEG